MDILSSVGASCARDLTEKTLTYVNESRNQKRKLNRPAFQKWYDQYSLLLRSPEL